MKPTWWPNRTGPARPSPPPLLPLLSSSSCQWEQLRARTRAAEEATSSLPGCLLLPRSLPRRHAAPTPSHFSLALWTSLPPRSSVSPPATERSRRHRREPPWLPATPRLTDAPGSSAGPPSTSLTSHEAPDVPKHRPRCLLQPRDRRPSSSNSPAPDRPRPRRASPRHRRESLTLSPNSACSPPCRSAVPHEHRSHRPPLLLHA